MSNVLNTIEEGVLRVTVNRPDKRNPLSREVLTHIRDVFDAHASDESIKVAVIRGAGDAAFAAGGDLKELAQVRTAEDTRAMHELGYAALESVRTFPAPVVAALNGDALGGGAELAVAADIRVAAAHARIGFIQATLNITTAWGGTSDLIELVGRHRALRLLCTAEVLSAEQALDLGLYDKCADEDFDAWLENYIALFVRGSPRVLRGYKSMSLETRALVKERLLPAAETEAFITAWTHPDHWEKADKALNKAKAR